MYRIPRTGELLFGSRIASLEKRLIFLSERFLENYRASPATALACGRVASRRRAPDSVHTLCKNSSSHLRLATIQTDNAPTVQSIYVTASQLIPQCSFGPSLFFFPFVSLFLNLIVDVSLFDSFLKALKGFVH